jgi:hypothetical protein
MKTTASSFKCSFITFMIHSTVLPSTSPVIPFNLLCCPCHLFCSSKYCCHNQGLCPLFSLNNTNHFCDINDQSSAENSRDSRFQLLLSISLAYTTGTPNSKCTKPKSHSHPQPYLPPCLPETWESPLILFCLTLKVNHTLSPIIVSESSHFSPLLLPDYCI